MERDEINDELNKLPPNVQEVIAATTSFFLEADVHTAYLNDPNKLEVLKEQLKAQGLDDEAIRLTLKVCGFGNGKNDVNE